MASSGDGKSFSNVSTTQGPFTLFGGTYGVLVHAGSWSSGAVALQALAPDGVTYVTCLAAFSADGYGAAALPTGTYRLAVTTATAVYSSIARVN